MFVQSDRHVASYYAGTYPAPIPHRPALDERIDADVLVVGAGFSGLHTALRLALAGKRVVVLEASRVAWAASGRNGGQALLGWSCDMQPLEASLGRDGALAGTFRGEVEGEIALEPRGYNGFGYDPLFFYPPFGCTFGEASAAQKASVSHRGRALAALSEALGSAPPRP